MEKCKRCGKVLWNKTSIQLGYGNSCAKILGLIKSRRKRYETQGQNLNKWLQ